MPKKEVSKKYLKSELIDISTNKVISKMKIELDEKGNIDFEKLPKTGIDLARLHGFDSLPKTGIDLARLHGFDSLPKTGIDKFVNRNLDMLSKVEKFNGSFNNYKRNKFLFDLVEKSNQFQKFYLEEIKPKVNDTKKALSTFRKRIEELTKINPNEKDCIDWIFSKYYNNFSTFVKLSEKEILEEIIKFCDIKNKTFDDIFLLKIDQKKEPVKRQRPQTLSDYQEYVTFYCRQIVEFKKTRKEAIEIFVKKYGESARTLDRAIKKRRDILDGFKIKY